jgi:SAM-dependent methyltransferase
LAAVPTSPAFTPLDHYDPDRGGNAPLLQLQERQLTAIGLLKTGLAGRTGGRLLDVGCGDGLFLSELDARLGLSSMAWELGGVDFSSSMVKAAAGLPYAVRQCNVEDGIPFGDGTHDVVTAGEVIEHLYSPDRFVMEVRRILRRGGLLLITTPNLQAWYNRALFVAGIRPLFYEVSTKSTTIGAGPLLRLKKGATPVGHIRVFNLRGLLDLLRSEQFEPVAVRGATFDAVPGPLQPLDRALNRRPSLASNLVVLARGM